MEKQREIMRNENPFRSPEVVPFEKEAAGEKAVSEMPRQYVMLLARGLLWMFYGAAWWLPAAVLGLLVGGIMRWLVFLPAAVAVVCNLIGTWDAMWVAPQIGRQARFYLISSWLLAAPCVVMVLFEIGVFVVLVLFPLLMSLMQWLEFQVRLARVLNRMVLVRLGQFLQFLPLGLPLFLIFIFTLTAPDWEALPFVHLCAGAFAFVSLPSEMLLLARLRKALLADLTAADEAEKNERCGELY